MSEQTITPEMTMEDILHSYPSAQRALFQRYHIGGCSSCGFQPSDTLAQVCKDHNLLDTNEVVRHILTSHEADQRLQVDADQVRTWLGDGNEVRFIDVRMPHERESDPFPEAEALDFNDQGKYMALPKDTRRCFRVEIWGPILDGAESRNYANALRQLIHQAGLEDTMCLMGPTQEVPRVLAQSDFFILPSTNEPCSVALMEALAMGLPASRLPKVVTRRSKSYQRPTSISSCWIS